MVRLLRVLPLLFFVIISIIVPRGEDVKVYSRWGFPMGFEVFICYGTLPKSESKKHKKESQKEKSEVVSYTLVDFFNNL